MRRSIAIFTFMLSILLFQGCKTGFNRTDVARQTDGADIKPVCATNTANSAVDDVTLLVFERLAEMTCEDTVDDGFIMGQRVRPGNKIAGGELEFDDYIELFTAMKIETGKTPAILSLDYENDKIFTLDELHQANDIIELHWQEGGLVEIRWTPVNPWINDGSDLDDNPGSSNDLDYLASNDNEAATNELEELLDPSTEIYQTWRLRLDHIADALLNLQARDPSVTVLWSPLPSMNTYDYWWGLDASYDENDPDNASLYTELWKDMYLYLTETKGLNNLLWVFSPAKSGTESQTEADWAYPDPGYVDIVAGTATNNLLDFDDYVLLKNLNKPLGMSNYGPKPGGLTANTFDNRLYGETLRKRYPYVAYWISNFSYNVNGTWSTQSIIENQNTQELVNMADIFSLEDNVRE